MHFAGILNLLRTGETMLKYRVIEETSYRYFMGCYTGQINGKFLRFLEKGDASGGLSFARFMELWEREREMSRKFSKNYLL